jgi:hypothetical protein
MKARNGLFAIVALGCAVALSTPALAGGFGFSFSYGRGGYYRPVYYAPPAYVYRSYAPVVVYDDFYAPDVVVYRDYAPRAYYRSYSYCGPRPYYRSYSYCGPRPYYRSYYAPRSVGFSFRYSGGHHHHRGHRH